GGKEAGALPDASGHRVELLPVLLRIGSADVRKAEGGATRQPFAEGGQWLVIFLLKLLARDLGAGGEAVTTLLRHRGLRQRDDRLLAVTVYDVDDRFLLSVVGHLEAPVEHEPL